MIVKNENAKFHQKIEKCDRNSNFKFYINKKWKRYYKNIETNVQKKT